MKTVKKLWIRRCWLYILSFLLLLAGFSAIIPAIRYNRILDASFVPNDDYQLLSSMYTDGFDDFSEERYISVWKQVVENLSPFDWLLGSYGVTVEVQRPVMLDDTINYYEKPSLLSGKQVRLPANTAIYEDQEHRRLAYLEGVTFPFDDNGLPIKREDAKAIGIHPVFGFPTDDSGWRLAAPFMTNQRSSPSDDYYFVQTADILKMARAFYDEFVSDLYPESSFEDYCNRCVFYSDWILYENGVCISPNLKKPVFTAVSIPLFAAAGAFLAAGIAVSLIRGRKIVK